MPEESEWYKSTVDLNRENVKQFREHHPQQGSLKWFINACLEEYNANHVDTTEEEIAQAVGAAGERMIEGEKR